MWPFDVPSAPVAPTSSILDNGPSLTPVYAPHPYYPLEIEITGYLANQYGVPTLIALFAAGCAGIFTLTHIVVTHIRPGLPTSELLTILWFVLSGCIHAFFEGYYVYNFRAMGGLQTLFGQLWKEYSLSDSRYLTRDPFVLCMETITAVFWGPLSFVVAYMISTEHVLRHPLQIIVSLGQLYGDVLYYATSMFDHYIFDKSYSRPEPYYFYGYYVFMNAFWIVIPTCLILGSVKASGRAANVLKKVGERAGRDAMSKKTKTT